MASRRDGLVVDRCSGPAWKGDIALVVSAVSMTSPMSMIQILLSAAMASSYSRRSYILSPEKAAKYGPNAGRRTVAKQRVTDSPSGARSVISVLISSRTSVVTKRNAAHIVAALRTQRLQIDDTGADHPRSATGSWPGLVPASENEHTDQLRHGREGAGSVGQGGGGEQVTSLGRKASKRRIRRSRTM